MMNRIQTIDVEKWSGIEGGESQSGNSRDNDTRFQDPCPGAYQIAESQCPSYIIR